MKVDNVPLMSLVRKIMTFRTLQEQVKNRINSCLKRKKLFQKLTFKGCYLGIQKYQGNHQWKIQTIHIVKQSSLFLKKIPKS